MCRYAPHETSFVHLPSCVYFWTFVQARCSFQRSAAGATTVSCNHTQKMEEQKNERRALVTGGNRGIGLAVVKALSKHPDVGAVVFTSTKAEAGQQVLQTLQEEGYDNVQYQQLDLSDPENINSFLENAPEQIDILVNNAGVVLDFRMSIFEASQDLIQQTLQINTFGALQLSKHFIAQMVERGYGRVVNMVGVISIT